MASNPPLPWSRVPDETPKAYQAFKRYRDAGPERNLSSAFPKNRKRNGKGAPHGTIRVWSTKHNWVARCQAWDDHIAALAADKERDAALALRVAEIEEETKQRKLRLDEARALRESGRRVLHRFLVLAAAGEVDKLLLKRVKHTKTTLAPGGFAEKHEDEQKGITELMGLAIQAISEGQKQERLEKGEPTERMETTENEGQVISKLVRLMRDFCPPERWGEFAQKLEQLEAEDEG